MQWCTFFIIIKIDKIIKLTYDPLGHKVFNLLPKENHMIEETLKKFGYPNTIIKEYSHWIILVRQKQVTLGSLVLICKEQVDGLSHISKEAWGELPLVVSEIETNLKRLFNNDKINYLMLMMVDPEVHYHVIPRYELDREFDSIRFVDNSWPTAPDMSLANDISNESMLKLIETLKTAFTKK